MFALSRDGKRVFLHKPDAGIVVPVLLDLENKKLTVRVPSVVELEDDYAVYDDLGDVLLAVSLEHRGEVNFARKFSQECSTAYRDQLSTGKLTVSELRRLVEDHLRRAAGFRSNAASAEASVSMETELLRSFSGG